MLDPQIMTVTEGAKYLHISRKVPQTHRGAQLVALCALLAPRAFISRACIWAYFRNQRQTRMKLTANLADAYCGCEECDPDSWAPCFELVGEGRVCFRHLRQKWKNTKDPKERAHIRDLLMPVSRKAP